MRMRGNCAGFFSLGGGARNFHVKKGARMAAPRQGLSDSQVEKAFGAIQYLSSLQILPTESGSSGGADTPSSVTAAQIDGTGRYS